MNLNDFNYMSKMLEKLYKDAITYGSSSMKIKCDGKSLKYEMITDRTLEANKIKPRKEYSTIYKDEDIDAIDAINYVIASNPAIPWRKGWYGGPHDQASAVNETSNHIEKILDNRKPKCECGADKARSPRHSEWCPKHGD